jgi:dolichol kinase
MEALSQVADDLFELVIDIDPARTTWDRISDRAALKARQLAQRIDVLEAQLAGTKLEGALDLRSASRWLVELADDLANKKSEERWRAHYVALAKSYDDMVRASTAARLEELGRFRRLSPANHSRSFFHALSGVVGAVAYHFLLDRTSALLVMSIFVATFTALEILRRTSAKANDAMMRFPLIRRIARAREYYEINSSTYYGWGMLFAVYFCSQQAVEAGCLVLAFGDPMASYLGRRFGKLKLFRDKSLVGSLAFFGAAFLAVLAFRLALYPGDVAMALGVAAVAGLAGALTELFTFKLDDNFSVPLLTAIAVTLVF